MKESNKEFWDKVSKFRKRVDRSDKIHEFHVEIKGDPVTLALIAVSIDTKYMVDITLYTMQIDTMKLEGETLTIIGSQRRANKYIDMKDKIFLECKGYKVKIDYCETVFNYVSDKNTTIVCRGNYYSHVLTESSVPPSHYPYCRKYNFRKTCYGDIAIIKKAVKNFDGVRDVIEAMKTWMKSRDL